MRKLRLLVAILIFSFGHRQKGTCRLSVILRNKNIFSFKIYVQKKSPAAMRDFFFIPLSIVIGYSLLVTRYWLLVIGYWLLAIRRYANNE